MNITLRCVSILLAAAPLFAQAEIAFDSAPNFLKLPDHTYLGEVAGVASDSKGNVYVYTRTGGTQTTIGASRYFTHGGSRLFEFDGSGKFLREIGQGAYGLEFAEGIRIDPQDNIWIIDRGSSMIIKFGQDGRVMMTLGRKPEAVTFGTPNRGGGARRGGGRGPQGAGTPGDNFNRPTDVAWDSSGNIYVADGYGNSRIAKFDKNGKFLKSWGARGTETGMFDTPRSLAVDAAGKVYVADAGNKRIQVFDSEGNFQSTISNVGTPWAICLSPGAHPYLFSSNSNDPETLDNGEIYKLELDGQIVGKFGRAGKLMKEFGTVNSIDCRNPNQLYVGEVINWRVQKLSLH